MRAAASVVAATSRGAPGCTSDEADPVRDVLREHQGDGVQVVEERAHLPPPAAVQAQPGIDDVPACRRDAARDGGARRARVARRSRPDLDAADLDRDGARARAGPVRGARGLAWHDGGGRRGGHGRETQRFGCARCGLVDVDDLARRSGRPRRRGREPRRRRAPASRRGTQAAARTPRRAAAPAGSGERACGFDARRPGLVRARRRRRGRADARRRWGLARLARGRRDGRRGAGRRSTRATDGVGRGAGPAGRGVPGARSIEGRCANGASTRSRGGTPRPSVGAAGAAEGRGVGAAARADAGGDGPAAAAGRGGGGRGGSGWQRWRRPLALEHRADGRASAAPRGAAAARAAGPGAHRCAAGRAGSAAAPPRSAHSAMPAVSPASSSASASSSSSRR